MSCFWDLTQKSLKEEMVTHSSILTWKIPQTEEPGGLQSMRLQSVGYDLVTEHAYKQKPEWKELMGIYPRAEFTRLVDTVQSLSRVWLFATPWITWLFSSCGMWVSHCGGFSCCTPWSRGAWTSVAASGSRAQIQQLWCTAWAALRNVGSAGIREQTHVSCFGRRILYHWATR